MIKSNIYHKQDSIPPNHISSIPTIKYVLGFVVSHRITLLRSYRPCSLAFAIIFISSKALSQLIDSLWTGPIPNSLPSKNTFSSITSHFIGTSSSLFNLATLLSFISLFSLFYILVNIFEALLTHIHIAPSTQIKSPRFTFSYNGTFVIFRSKLTYSFMLFYSPSLNFYDFF